MQCDPLLPIVKTVSKLFICFTHEPRIAQHFPEKHYESHKLMKSTLKERIFSSFFLKKYMKIIVQLKNVSGDLILAKYCFHFSLNLLAMLPGTLTCSNKNIVYFITFQLQIHIAHIKTGRIRCWVPNHLVILQTNQAV